LRRPNDGRVRYRPVTTLYILIGLPGSGKSSWARENCSRLDAVVVGSDEIRREFRASGGDFFHDDIVFAELEGRARSFLTAGQSVIIDATHLARRYRTYTLELSSDTHAERVAIWFDVPLETCLRRNAGRSNRTFGDQPVPAENVRELDDLFQPPGDDEFDEVVRLTA
jgi:protein phosphatase